MLVVLVIMEALLRTCTTTSFTTIRSTIPVRGVSGGVGPVNVFTFIFVCAIFDLQSSYIGTIPHGVLDHVLRYDTALSRRAGAVTPCVSLNVLSVGIDAVVRPSTGEPQSLFDVLSRHFVC